MEECVEDGGGVLGMVEMCMCIGDGGDVCRGSCGSV